MHYDPNYKGQIFYNSSNAIGIDEVLGLLKQELSTQPLKTKMPKTKTIKIIQYSLLGLIVLCLLITAFVWIFTKSLAYTVVIFIMSAVYVVGIMAIIAAIAISIARKACSDPVDAVCIGYSISGNSDSSRYGSRISRSPVFQYQYHGYNFTAFDGLYDNFSQMPMMATTTKILVNPSDPEDLVWNFKRNRERFLILAGIFGIVLCTAMMYVVHNDDNFMNSVIPARAAAVEAQKQKEAAMAGSENVPGAEETGPRLSDDGRIILDDQYIRSEVWAAFPDKEYIIKARKVTELEVADDQSFYVLHFEEDPDFVDAEWFFGQEELTDEVKNAKPGDEFYYTQIPEIGASKLFSTKEYVLPE